jgi:hypothetical protein
MLTYQGFKPKSLNYSEIKNMARKKDEIEDIGMELFDHNDLGNIFRRFQRELEVAKCRLAKYYPKSSKKEIKQIESAIEKIYAVQLAGHRRLLQEFHYEPEGSLLPVYLGKPAYVDYSVPKNSHRTAPRTDETTESDTEPHDSETSPLQPDAEDITSNGSSDLVVDQDEITEN